MSKGPDQQTQTAAAPVMSITRSVSAPALTEDRVSTFSSRRCPNQICYYPIERIRMNVSHLPLSSQDLFPFIRPLFIFSRRKILSLMNLDPT